MCLWNTDAPGGNKVKIWQKSLIHTFWPHSTPRGMWCQWSVRNPYMKLRSKFGYCIITQTLNIALCFISGTELWTDGRTDKQRDGQMIRLLDAFQAGGIKNVLFHILTMYCMYGKVCHTAKSDCFPFLFSICPKNKLSYSGEKNKYSSPVIINRNFYSSWI